MPALMHLIKNKRMIKFLYKEGMKTYEEHGQMKVAPAPKQQLVHQNQP